MLVYLDYNVLVSLHHGDFRMDSIYNAVGTDNVVLPYSSSHIEEVKNITGSECIPRDKAVAQMLAYVDALSRNVQIQRTSFDMPSELVINSTFNTYDTINDVPGTEKYYSLFSNLIPEPMKKVFRDQFNLDSNQLNNIKPEEIINHLNTKVDISGYKLSFNELLQQSQAMLPSEWKWGIETNATAVFTFLDMVGYWKDKGTSSSNVARMWDASHCGLAAECDVLVSNDQRMRLKSEVVYRQYGITTRILAI